MTSNNVDCHNEIMRMRKLLSKDHVPVAYLPLGAPNLYKIPRMVTSAARQGHWVVLDNFHFVQKYLPAIQKFLQQMFKYEQVLQREKEEKEAMRKNALERFAEGLDAPNNPILAKPALPQAPIEAASQAFLKDKIVLEMPELPEFKILSSFRLWIASIASDDIPISWLQECNNIVLEPP
jgi:hypothetical protein